MTSPRIAVVGLGTMGAQCAWQLVCRGATVVGYETYAPGHARGAAGGENRLFRTLELEDPRYSPIVARADELWSELEYVSGRELRTTTGSLLMGDPDSAQMTTAVRNAAAIGTPHEIWDEAGLRTRHPQFRLDPGDIAVWDERGGYIRPELTVATTAALAEDRGADLRRDTRVLDIAQGPSGVAVTTEAGREVFDRAVVAAGAWTRTLLPRMRDELITRRLISAWFFGRDAAYLDAIPPFIRAEPTYCYGLPTPDYTAMKLGLGFDHHLPFDDPDTVERTTRPDELTPFQETARRYLPGLQSHPMRVETYLETYTPTRREWVGPHPDMPDVIVLAGFSGHGFKMCPAIGELGADLALDVVPRMNADFLTHPDRRRDVGAPS
ncbi:MAG TPA: N-methyl-L-tryptophan oxidase [Nocardioidaceae bacterium]|nr:N-methyl-L-tryptophan oxidase [Nocardioidaceae bacterium]